MSVGPMAKPRWSCAYFQPILRDFGFFKEIDHLRGLIESDRIYGNRKDIKRLTRGELSQLKEGAQPLLVFALTIRPQTIRKEQHFGRELVSVLISELENRDRLVPPSFDLKAAGQPDVGGHEPGVEFNGLFQMADRLGNIAAPQRIHSQDELLGDLLDRKSVV